MSKFSWTIFGLLAVGIGCYPFIYFVIDMTGGLLSSKSDELLQSFWMEAFYLHIIPGGLALLIGWLQFSHRIRRKYMSLHRIVGKVYLYAVAISGFAGLYISYSATGGNIAVIGFAFLAIAWLSTSFMGWKTIREGNIPAHQRWMIRSYALCFAAVTLRLWLPTFLLLGIPFLTGYVIIAWLCWVPNLIFAEWIIRRKRRPEAFISS